MNGERAMPRNLHERLAALEDECEGLRHLIAEMTGEGATPEIVAPGLGAPVRVEPQVGTLWSMLSRRFGAVVTYGALHAALCGTRPECDWPEWRIVQVQMVALRSALRGSDVAVETVWGIGYRLRHASDPLPVAPSRARRERALKASP